jgi:branched-chain amino acid transport system substrate-binding protein
MRRRFLTIAPLALFVSLALAACGGSDSGDSGGTIKIGASLPLTGPLSGPFGPQLKAGYQNAVDAVNADGGLDVGGSKQKVELVIDDNASDPNTATQQARSLIDQDGVVALLGAVTPALTIPISNVAEQLQVPMVTSVTPIRAWLAGNPDGWKYSWDLFFDEAQQTDMQFKAADLAPTNKKIALFTDNEQDGVVMGGLWEDKAPQFGYQVVYHANFPVGTTDFSSFIDKAKSSGAQVVITQMVPPDGIALWKQMKALNYSPEFAACEKCADGAAWQQALGPIAEGTSATGWWSPALNRPDTEQFVNKFQDQFGDTQDLATVVAGDTAAQVLLDAIQRAGSTDASKINDAISQTDASYPFGHVKFTPQHFFAVPAIETQWQGDAMKLVAPAGSNSSKLEAPVPGLQ